MSSLFLTVGSVPRERDQALRGTEASQHTDIVLQEWSEQFWTTIGSIDYRWLKGQSMRASGTTERGRSLNLFE